MRSIFYALAIIACTGLLTACGSTRTERALSGGAIGAGLGAGAAVATDGDVTQGAVIGGAAGAAAGALSTR